MAWVIAVLKLITIINNNINNNYKIYITLDVPGIGEVETVSVHLPPLHLLLFLLHLVLKSEEPRTFDCCYGSVRGLLLRSILWVLHRLDITPRSMWSVG